jgi:uncharacterized protein with PIN domain
MLGYDVKYSTTLGDAGLVTIAKREGRVLLTRDLELYKQASAKGIEAAYLEGKSEEERLAELARKFKINLEIDMAKSRCPKCNAKVKPILKEKTNDRVEKSTYTHYDKFWECPKCGQIYWQGAHWTKIRETLRMANERKSK